MQNTSVNQDLNPYAAFSGESLSVPLLPLHFRAAKYLVVSLITEGLSSKVTIGTIQQTPLNSLTERLADTNSAFCFTEQEQKILRKYVPTQSRREFIGICVDGGINLTIAASLAVHWSMLLLNSLYNGASSRQSTGTNSATPEEVQDTINVSEGVAKGATGIAVARLTFGETSRNSYETERADSATDWFFEQFFDLEKRALINGIVEALSDHVLRFFESKC